MLTNIDSIGRIWIWWKFWKLNIKFLIPREFFTSLTNNRKAKQECGTIKKTTIGMGSIPKISFSFYSGGKKDTPALAIQGFWPLNSPCHNLWSSNQFIRFCRILKFFKFCFNKQKYTYNTYLWIFKTWISLNYTYGNLPRYNCRLWCRSNVISI